MNIDSDDRNGSDWMQAADTLDAAKALLAKYEDGQPITISEGWLIRFAAELVKRDLTIEPWPELSGAINFLTKWADDINQSSGPSVDADSLRSIAELLTRLSSSRHACSSGI